MPTGSKFNRSELDEIFINDINICEKNIKNKVFREYFGYQSPSFPAFLAIFS